MKTIPSLNANHRNRGAFTLVELAAVLTLITVWACVGFALLLNRVVFGRRAEFELGTRQAWREAIAVLRT